MKRLLRVLEVLAWTGFFLLAVTVLGLRYWVLPNIERYREDIVSMLSRSIGQPVRIGTIEAGWLGLRPQVNFSDVRVLDTDGRDALVLPSVENVVSWRSLLAGQLRLHTLIVDSPRLGVRRDANGVLHVAGITVEQGKGDGAFANWVLSQNEIVVRNAEIEWVDEKRGAPPLALSQLNLRLRNAGPEHRVGLTARPPAELGSTLDLRAELAGLSATEPSTWNGRLFVELGYTDLAGWRRWIDYPVQVQSGQGAVRLWATLEQGRLTDGTADLELAGVAARLEPELPMLELARLSGRLQAHRTQDGFELAARKLVLEAVRGAAIGPSDFRLRWQPAGGNLAASAVELEPLAGLAEALPFPPEARKAIGELAPRGRLANLRAEWTGPLAQPRELNVRSGFAGLSMKPSGALPGFDGLSGTLEATRAKGTLHLASRDAHVELPAVLSEPRLPIDRLEGVVSWERPEAGPLVVRLQSLVFANEDAEGKAAGSYTRSEEGPGVIDLEASLRRVDGRHLSRYLPSAAILNQATRDWLAGSILAGQSSDARLRLKGDLRNFPFIDPAKGLFQVAAHVEKGVLQYAPGWPRIEDIDADLLFQADRMEIVARSASILGARVSTAQVRIPSFSTPPVRLVVDGQAAGPTGEFLRFIEASPLARMTGGATKGVAASGNGRLHLKLDLPLRELAAVKVDGSFEFASNQVSIPHGDLPPIDRARGNVTFTEAGFALHNVEGRVFGGAVTVSGGTRKGGGAEIVARGDANVAALRPVFDHAWRRSLSGTTAYNAVVFVREGRVHVVVQSLLRGVTSSLPPPFAKRAAEALPLRVDVYPANGEGFERIAARLGRVAALEIRRRRSGDEVSGQRVGVALMPPIAAAQVRLPEKPGLLIYGSLDTFDADRWLAFVADTTSAATGAGAPGAGMPLTLELKARTLDIYGKRIHDLSAQASADSAGWKADVDSREIAGKVSYQNDKGGLLEADLARLYVPQDYLGSKPREGEGSRDLPAIRLAAERFSFKDKELGRLELDAHRDGGDWRIERLALASPEGKVSGKGLWHAAAPAHTSVQLELDSGNAAGFLARLGYPNLVRGGRARMQADLGWAGDPSSIDYPSLTGAIQLQAYDGQFLEVDPGLGKLVSLMSLQALPRRLTLDFRDVFSKGFQFDEITSSGHVERGLMTLKDFHMRGSAAQVDMTGEVDLARETQNLSVRVVPSLGDSASTVLAFVNPLLVFPAALAQKILKDPLGHIFSFNYSITGSWADPKVAKRGVEAREVEHPGPQPGPNN